MSRVLALGTSMNSRSINRKLVAYAASLLPDSVVELVTPREFPLPLYNQDLERESGIPQPALDFLAAIASADALIISFAEHNGSYTAAFKNLFDWSSRAEQKVFQGKPILMLSTSPGGRGGATVLAQALAMAPHFDGVVVGSLAIPRSGQSLDAETGRVVDEALSTQLAALVLTLSGAMG
ncbi:MAG: chromate reductase [Cognaticolwellia sp.]|jgi:chromate reductase